MFDHMQALHVCPMLQPTVLIRNREHGGLIGAGNNLREMGVLRCTERESGGIRDARNVDWKM